MPQKINQKKQKEIKQKIERINKAFAKFEGEISGVKKEQQDIVKEIFKRIDKDKVQKILEDIKQS